MECDYADLLSFNLLCNDAGASRPAKHLLVSPDECCGTSTQPQPICAYDLHNATSGAAEEPETPPRLPHSSPACRRPPSSPGPTPLSAPQLQHCPSASSRPPLHPHSQPHPGGSLVAAGLNSLYDMLQSGLKISRRRARAGVPTGAELDIPGWGLAGSDSWLTDGESSRDGDSSDEDSSDAECGRDVSGHSHGSSSRASSPAPSGRASTSGFGCARGGPSTPYRLSGDGTGGLEEVGAATGCRARACVGAGGGPGGGGMLGRWASDLAGHRKKDD